MRPARRFRRPAADARFPVLSWFESAPSQAFPAAQRAAGQRRYDLDAIRRIKFVRMASRAGLSLADIRALLAGHAGRSPTFTDWAAAARGQLAAIDQRIADLDRLRATIEDCLACGCQHARRCKLLTTAVPRRVPARPRRP
jgi:MerR family transcriptional regulator, redox-sensitive transcriptional activator SoxR